MESAYILVIDAQPDSAEETKSLLRNSGINVRAVHAATASDIERLTREFTPILAVYQPGANGVIPLTETARVAADAGLLLTVRLEPADAAEITAVMDITPCIAIPPGHDAAFIRLVKRLSSASHRSSDIAGVLQENEDLRQRYDLLMDSTAEAIAYFHEGLHVYANRAYQNMLQAGGLDELGALSLLDIARSEDLDIKGLVRGFGQGQIPAHKVAMTVVPPGLEGFQAEVNFHPVRFDGEDCVQAVIRRAGEMVSIQAAMDEFHGLDPLTSLKTREAFMNELQQRIEQQPENMVSAVLMVEPDEYRTLERAVSVYDADRYLRAIGREFNRLADSNDLLARFADHVFIFCLERADRSMLREAAQAILSGFEQFFKDGHMDGLPQTCSIGLTMIGPQSLNAEEAIVQAREAMEQAREQGNTLKRYQPARSVPEHGGEDAQWQERIRFAINHEDFYSVQQSIVNLEGDSEGLFENRTFLHEEGGDLAPEEFMPRAEQHNLASTIDRLIIPGLLRSIAGTGDRHIVNLSGNSVHDFSFASWFQRQLAQHGVEGSQVILQVPAEAALTNLRAAQRLVEETQSLGCMLSISQFDDRPRTIGLFELLKISYVKLRSDLATELRQHADHQTIIKNVVHAADRTATHVMADNVKDSSDMASLWQCGVKLVSGAFLQSAPRASGQ